MKENIHPTYYKDAQVVCASCGTTWTTGSTKKALHVEVCSNCHPFYSGEQARLLDVEGQVDRFYKKLQARQSYVEVQKTKETSKTSPDRPVADLELSKRATEALIKAEVRTFGDLLAKLKEGEEVTLAFPPPRKNNLRLGNKIR
jgi:large subunit ribosomal protein L31